MVNEGDGDRLVEIGVNDDTIKEVLSFDGRALAMCLAMTNEMIGDEACEEVIQGEADDYRRVLNGIVERNGDDSCRVLFALFWWVFEMVATASENIAYLDFQLDMARFIAED